MTARCVMVLGTTSGAGKSWLTTALCRYYARQGLKVAPFKAQNMSNNARVVASENGQGEIGSAQYLWPQIAQALHDLRAENDVVVIEGAGSPAEINLHSSHIVNMRVALHCHAQCLLVTDIDRGGAFAHLYGTWALLPENERALIKGYVLNKFRGDATLLAPAPQMLQDLTGVPTVATLPMWWQHGLAPHDWIILPGSKNTSGDLAWLRAQGLDRAVAAHAAQGGAVLGICGGLQMLGEALIDTHGIDGNAPGLGLLPLVTVFEPEKTVQRTQAVFGNGMQPGSPWAPLAGVTVSGYEIHHGQTAQHPAMAKAGVLASLISSSPSSRIPS